MKNMTHDRKEDSKGGKDVEKSCKKTESSAAVSTDKTPSSAEGLPTKVTACDFTSALRQRLQLRLGGVNTDDQLYLRLYS